VLTLTDQLEENRAALRRAYGQAPRTGQVEWTIRHLELEREGLVRRALSRRDPDAIAWLAAYGGHVNAAQVDAERAGRAARAGRQG
jgi:hypothetical protein